MYYVFFFFSSRRRHTRLVSDWSSDVCSSDLSAAGLSGSYVEARTCDVWTGPCFANAEVNLDGKHAVLGWKIKKGSFDNVSLDGLSVVAVVAASDTLGVAQAGQAKAVLIVDRRASSAQRDALLRLAKSQAGALLRNVVRGQSGAIEPTARPGQNDARVVLNARVAEGRRRGLHRGPEKI